MKTTYKYLIIGGNKYKAYTGTTTFTGLTIIGKTNSVEDVKKICDDNYDDCGGLLMIIDAEKGEIADV